MTFPSNLKYDEKSFVRWSHVTIPDSQYTSLYYPILTPKKYKLRETWYIHSIRNMNCCSDETCISQVLILVIQNYI